MQVIARGDILWACNLMGDCAMTQHTLPEQTLEDQRTMRRLSLVVAGFLAFTAAMAVSIAVIMH
jgi:hypothetical protein